MRDIDVGTQPGKLHRALADEHRVQIVDELRRAPRGLDAHELARRLGLHANTVRWHLGVLADAAIVSSKRAERGGPGRPRIIYSLHEGPDPGDEESHRLLATILTGALSELDDGNSRAASAGRDWGRYLVKRAPNKRLRDDEALVETVELLAEQGFRPEADGHEIRMHHCPYRELAPGIVCAVHQGIIDGALAELGSNLGVERLDPLVEPELCIARLGGRATT